MRRGKFPLWTTTTAPPGDCLPAILTIPKGNVPSCFASMCSKATAIYLGCVLTVPFPEQTNVSKLLSPVKLFVWCGTGYPAWPHDFHLQVNAYRVAAMCLLRVNAGKGYLANAYSTTDLRQHRNRSTVCR